MGTARASLSAWPRKAKTYVLSHKIMSLVLLAALLGGGYWTYGAYVSTDGETRYILSPVRRDTIKVTVTGTGQVSASNQIDVKPKVSGDITSVTVTNGEAVTSGQVIAYVDSRTAQKAVRDAEANLKSAEIALQKLQKPTDNLSLIQSENALSKAQESKITSEAALARSYEEGFSDVANAFLELPEVMTGIQDMLYTGSAQLGGTSIWNLDYYTDVIKQYDSIQASSFRADAHTKFQAAKSAYDTSFTAYKAASRTDSPESIEALIQDTYKASQTIAEAVKSANNLLQLYKDELTERSLTPKELAETQLSSLNTYTGTTNAHLTNLLDATSAIVSNKEAIVNAERTIKENTQSLADLQAGSDALDLESAQLTVTQRKNSLQDAKESLSDYAIRAPFVGTIATLAAKRGDTVSSGTSVATLITKEQLAEISLNEVDAAKVAVGDPATLTFDAIEDLEISGAVAEIDTVGTVAQGVVSYTVKVSFNTQDERIKSGMSVSAEIVTDEKGGALIIPSEAIQFRGNAAYVEVLEGVSVPQMRMRTDRQNASTTPSAENTPERRTLPTGSTGLSTRDAGVTSPTPPIQKTVTVGLSSDTMAEILTGLSEGEMVVTRTIGASEASAATPSTAPSLFGPGGRTGGGGNAVRVQR